MMRPANLCIAVSLGFFTLSPANAQTSTEDIQTWHQGRGGHGYGWKGGEGRGPCSKQTDEQSQAIQKAIADKNFAEWRDLMLAHRPGTRLMEVINANNFAEFVRMHQFLKEGKVEEAREIRQELGLFKGRRGGGRGR